MWDLSINVRFVHNCEIFLDKSGATELQRPKVELKSPSQEEEQQLLNFKDQKQAKTALFVSSQVRVISLPSVPLSIQRLIGHFTSLPSLSVMLTYSPLQPLFFSSLIFTDISLVTRKFWHWLRTSPSNTSSNRSALSQSPFLSWKKSWFFTLGLYAKTVWETCHH